MKNKALCQYFKYTPCPALYTPAACVPVVSRSLFWRHWGTKTVISLWPRLQNVSTASAIPRQEKNRCRPWLVRWGQKEEWYCKNDYQRGVRGTGVSLCTLCVLTVYIVWNTEIHDWINIDLNIIMVLRKGKTNKKNVQGSFLFATNHISSVSVILTFIKRTGYQLCDWSTLNTVSECTDIRSVLRRGVRIGIGR